MRLSRYLAFTAVLFAFAIPACSSDTVSAPGENTGENTGEDSGSPDSGTSEDSSADSSKDSGTDSSKDSGVDSATDVSKDQQTDSEDSASDVSPDTKFDTGAPDSSPDSSKDSSGDVAADTAKDTSSDVIACMPLTGLGTVTCPCGKPNDVEWNATTTPFWFDSHLDFGTAGWDPTQLTPGGKIVFETDNAGGDSVASETAAYEMLARCDFATLIKTETQITYKTVGGKMTDILVLIDGRKVGVSVVRAFHYPPTAPYTLTEATSILKKKLTDIPLSAANATAADAWERSILAVIAYNQQSADTAKAAWETLSPSLRGDVILYTTVTDGNDDAIY